MTTITSQNTFTPQKLIQSRLGFDVMVSGSFTATVTVQLSKDGVTWFDVDSSTSPAILTGITYSAWFIRAGVKTGDYSGGTVEVEVY